MKFRTALKLSDMSKVQERMRDITRMNLRIRDEYPVCADCGQRHPPSPEGLQEALAKLFGAPVQLVKLNEMHDAADIPQADPKVKH